MHAAQLRLPFVFPYFSQLALPRRLRGRLSRAANSQGSSPVTRAAAARVTSDKDHLTALMEGETFANALARAQAPGFDHRQELAGL